MLPLSTSFETDDYLPPKIALDPARGIDEQFAAAWRCVEKLRVAFNGLSQSDRRDGKVEEILRDTDINPS